MHFLQLIDEFPANTNLNQFIKQADKKISD